MSIYPLRKACSGLALLVPVLGLAWPAFAQEPPRLAPPAVRPDWRSAPLTQPETITPAVYMSALAGTVNTGPGQGGGGQGGGGQQGGGQQGGGQQGQFPQGGTPEDLTTTPTQALELKAQAFPMGEFFYLGPDKDIPKIKTVYFSRDYLVERIQTTGPVFKGLAKRLGTVVITLVGENNKQKAYTVRIVPDINFIRLIVKKQFPRASLQIAPAGDNLLVVEGTVDSPGEVDTIIKFLEGFVEKGGRVLNGIQVVGVQQVQLEVCIAQVDRSVLRNMGVNYLQSNAQGFFGNQTGSIIGPPSILVGGTTLTDGSRVFTNFNSAASGTTSSVLGATPNIFFGITRVGSAFFGFLEALRAESLAKILATPTLVTLNGRAADFLVGGEVPVVAVVGSGLGAVPNVDFKPFGTRVTFLPVLLGDGKIRLDVIPEVSRPVGTSSVTASGIPIPPSFVTQRIHTTVEMENGQTLAMGGLLQNTDNVTINKVPILGDIPYLGTLFRTVSHERDEQELLVLVTPRLVEPLQGCQRPAILPGQEARTPTDKELFMYGMPETPVGPPVGKLPPKMPPEGARPLAPEADHQPILPYPPSVPGYPPGVPGLPPAPEGSTGPAVGEPLPIATPPQAAEKLPTEPTLLPAPPPVPQAPGTPDGR